MRKKQSFLNMAYGVTAYTLTIILSFVVQTIFIRTLGLTYLGINGLFTNILSMLSLAELGIGTAIIYNLYKPIAINDREKIKALMGFYAKSYKIIACAVLFIGLLIIPFLNIFIKNKPDIPESIYLIYILFLINSILSYLFVYKQSIFIADQKERVISQVSIFFSICSSFIQIAILLLSKNFIAFLIIKIVLELIKNIYLAVRANRLYPFLRDNKKTILKKDEAKNIFKDVRALFIYRISGAVINGTDNIIISAFIGIIYVGLYSNYLLIIKNVTMFISQIFNALKGSIGNLVASEDRNKQYSIFNIYLFASFWIYSFAAICLWVLINPFIQLWIGEKFLLSKEIVFVIVFDFYIVGIMGPTTTYRTTMGLFVQGQYRPLIMAIINITLSIVLVQYFNILGVFLGTVISRVVTQIWYDPYIVYKYGFKQSSREYYLKFIIYMLVFLSTGIIINIICLFFPSVTILSFLGMIALCILIPNVFFLLLFHNTAEFKYLKKLIQPIGIILRNKLAKLK